VSATTTWIKNVIKEKELNQYLIKGKDFIDTAVINNLINKTIRADQKQIKDILAKALDIKRLEPLEVATLLQVKDEGIWQEMYNTALQVKKKVYDNRIVFFAPLYLSNKCVNNCIYCGFRTANTLEKRNVLNTEAIKAEAAAILSEGHKRIIAVYGEHPDSSIDYITHSMETIYSVNKNTAQGQSGIRRINVNAAPMAIADLKKLLTAGIGTYQVFQETYHKNTYNKVHPITTIKGNYQWRLYALHRAMAAGIDDVAIGALFGLYDWRFEIMGLLYHAIDLEQQFGIGPHTISFPRIKNAFGSNILDNSQYLVSDQELKKIITILRLAIPYTGLIITARETPQLRKQLINVGCTQTDASSRIGLGGYSAALDVWTKNQNKNIQQDTKKQQFDLGDTRRLDEVIAELAEQAIISSFCTSGYRCGRTGNKIMKLLCTGVEGKYCKLNAVLTFKEYLEDYASEHTKEIGEKLIAKEKLEIKNSDWFKKNPKLITEFKKLYSKIESGERDLYI